MIFVISLGAAAIFIQESDIESLIKANVEHQTGGKLEFSKIDYSVLHGLTLRKIRFTPPSRTDNGGYINQGALETQPVFTAEQMKIHYSLPALLLLNLNISAVKLEKANLYIETSEHGSNLDGITSYRKRYFPAVDAPEPSHPANPAKLKISELLPVVPNNLFLPLRLSINDVGFEDLTVHIKNPSADGTGKNLAKIGPISALSRFHWVGFKSKLTFRIFNSKATSIEVTGDNALFAALDLDSTLEVEDFVRISIASQNSVREVRLPGYQIRDIPMMFQLGANFSKQYDQLKIEKFNLSLLDAVTYMLEGDISLPNDDFEVFRLNLRQKFKGDLFALNRIINQVLPHSNLFGLVELTNLDIHGDIKPSELSASKLELPHIKAILNFVDVKADLSDFGLSIEPINGSISVGLGPNTLGSGSQADAMVDLRVPNIKFNTVSENKTYQIEVVDLVTSLNARGLFPKPALPFFKLNMDATNIIATENGLETARVPLEFDIDLEVKEHLTKLSTDIKMNLPTLFEASLSGGCREKCKDLKVTADLDIRSLKQAFGIIQPILQRRLSLKAIPTKLTGVIASKATIRGGVQDLNHVAITSLIEDGNIDINMYANLNDVDLDLPGYGVSLSGFNSRAFLDGDLKKAKLIFKQDFSQLKLEGNTLVKGPVNVENFRFETEASTHTSGPFSLKNPATNLATSLDVNLGITKISAPGYIPRPLQNPKLKIKAFQDRMRHLTVEKILVEIPDFGTEVLGKIETGIGKKFAPESLASEFKIAMNHGVGKALPSGVRSSGDAEIQIAAHSKDMKHLDILGGISFDHFSIDVPETDDPNKTLLRIEDIHGTVPLQQSIDLTRFVGISSKPQKFENDININSISTDYFERNRDFLNEQENRILGLDYGSVRPFYPEKNPLTIKQINFRDLAMKKLEMDLELRQNWFAVNQFMIQFLNGKIHGGIQFAFDPNPIALNANLHLTRLDTRKLLEGFPKFRRKVNSFSLFSDPYLDATMHLRFNLKNNEIDGGVDITSIGKDQLRMILYYVDPQQANPTISQIRSALNFGEVSQVSVPIRNGFIGMNVDVNVLSAPIPLPELRGFPIAQVVRNFRDQPDTISDEQDVGTDVEKSSEENDEQEEVNPDDETFAH